MVQTCTLQLNSGEQSKMDYPQLLQIETTALCNAGCSFCSHKSMKRTKGEMSWTLFIKIIEQCKELKVKRICPFLNGEPFIDSLFIERLAYINQELPDTKIDIFSNMSLLNSEKLYELSKIKNIETFFMSLTSYDTTSCKKYMNLNFDTVHRNVLSLIALNRKEKFIKQLQGSSINMGLEENNKFKNCWGNVGIGNYFISVKQNWLGSIQSNVVSNQNIICPRAFHLCIYFDGTVPVCCFDNDGKYTFGNVKDKTLLEIYNSEEYRQYRILKKKDLEPCNRCTV